MKVLVLNSGSSSLKFQVIDMTNLEGLAEGICERIGAAGSTITYKQLIKKTKEITEVAFPTHKEAIEEVLKKLQTGETAVINSLDELGAIGHRVVHGGEMFDKSVIITDEVLEKLKTVEALAPLHNPANVMGIKICQELMPGKQNVATFDTAFHQTMPAKAFMYGLPYADYEDLKVRKYGFHGTSHYFVSQKANELLNKGDAKVIVCHLGNGSSISAVKGGKCVDTSMGLTPLQGVVMGTRCGDIDPAAVLYIMEKRGLTSKEMDTRMNKESGILGLFEENSSDFRDVRDKALSGDERANLVVDILTYKIRSYVGSYAAALGGVDAICFTGGIGENAELVREKVCQELEYMGIEFDNDKNYKFRELADEDGVVDLSKDNSKVRVFVIPTNEELVIAKDTYALVK